MRTMSPTRKVRHPIIIGGKEGVSFCTRLFCAHHHAQLCALAG